MMESFSTDIDECIKNLKKGNLILYPTDTIWGIGCDATNEKAVEKIYQLKKRSDEKAMIVLVADEKKIEKYVELPDPELVEYLSKVNKPTTVVYKNAHHLAANLIAKDGSIAIRICKEAFCNQLLKKFGKPIVSTSANISSKPFPKNFSEISNEIKQGVDYVVRWRQDEKKMSDPSALIKWEKGRVIILRS